MNAEAKTPDLVRLIQNLENAVTFYSVNLGEIEAHVRRLNNTPKNIEQEQGKINAPASCFVEELSQMIHRLENENQKLNDVLRILNDTI